MSTYPKAPGSPHTSPTTGAIAEELGWTPQSSLGMAQLHAKHTNAYSLLPPLDTKVPLSTVSAQAGSGNMLTQTSMALVIPPSQMG